MVTAHSLSDMKFCISYFSVSVIELFAWGNLWKKEWIHHDTEVWNKQATTVTGSESWKLMSSNLGMRKRERTGSDGILLISTPAPSHILLPANFPHLSLLKHHHQVSKCPRLWGIFFNQNTTRSLVSRWPTHCDISKVICNRHWCLLQKRKADKVAIRVQKLKLHVVIVNWEIMRCTQKVSEDYVC